MAPLDANPPDPATFRFRDGGAHGTDLTSYFSVGSSQAVGTNVPLSDHTTNTLSATITGYDTTGAPRTDEDDQDVDVNTTPSPNVSSGPYNFDHQVADRCAAACFAATEALSTIPYVTLGAPRGVTLVYNGDRAAPRPFISVDVQTPAGSNAPQQFWLQVKVGGAFRPFTNGDTSLHFTAGTQQVRLAGQVDASSYSTGAYPLDIIVSSQYPTQVSQTTVSTQLVVVNEAASPIARGWTVAGVQRLYLQSDGSALVTDGAGSAVYFLKPCGNCSFASPVGEFTQLVTGPGSGWTRLYPDSTKVVFTSTGLLSQSVDRFGNTTSFVFDGQSRLSKIQDPLYTTGTAHQIVLGYGAEWGIDSISDPMGRVTLLTVGNDSTLTAWRDPDGVTTGLSYDGSRRLASITDRRGSVTALKYALPSWKVDSVVLPAIPLSTGSSQSPVFALSPWQLVGVPATTTLTTPFTPVTGSGIQASITDPEGHLTTFTVDRWGQPLLVTDPLNRTTTIVRDGNGLPLGITYPGNHTETYNWNTSGLPTLVKPITATATGATHYRYGAYGQPDSVWGVDQATQKLYLGTAGRVDSVRYGGLDSVKVRLTYDSRGRVLSASDPKGHTTYYHYEATFGNLDSTLAAGARFARAKFDRYGRDSALTANSLPWRRELYDVINRPTQVYDGVNANPTSFSYDSLFLTRVQDAKGQVYRFQYNALGVLTRRFDPADTLTRYDSVLYNRDLLPVSVVNRRHQRQTLAFDILHRLVARTDSAAADSFAYSTDGRITVAWNAWQRDSIAIHSEGWRDSAVTRVAGQRFRIKDFRNSVGEIDSTVITDSAGISFVTRRYYRGAALHGLDSLGLNTVRLRLTANADGLQLKTVLPTAPTVTLGATFTTLDGLWADTIGHAALTAALGHTYGHDSLYRIVHRTNAGPLVETASTGQDFFYDSLGRLTRVDYGTYLPKGIGNDGCIQAQSDGWYCYIHDLSTPDSTKTYTYDQVGNRTDQSATYATGNRLTAFAGKTHSYDLDGNLTADSSGSTQLARYFWSASGRLDSVTTAIVRVGFVYDALGRLIRKTRNGAVDRYFLWDGGQLLAELNASVTQRIAEFAYYPGVDRPMALITGATTPTTFRYYKQDALGNVIGVVRDTLLDQNIVYDPWGVQQQVTGSLADTNGLRWKGLLWDSDVGLSFMRLRWYDPHVGRFVSEDPLGLVAGVNQYAFGASEPINNRDPSGLGAPAVVVAAAAPEAVAVVFVAAVVVTAVYLESRYHVVDRIVATLTNICFVCHMMGEPGSDKPPHTERDPMPPIPVRPVEPDNNPRIDPVRPRLPWEGHGSVVPGSLNDPTFPYQVGPGDMGGRTAHCHLESTVTVTDPSGRKTTTSTLKCDDGTTITITTISS